MIILEDKEQDWRMQLALAHYSISLSSVFVLEYSFAHIMNHHFKVKKSAEPLRDEQLLEIGSKFSEIFSKEHLMDLFQSSAAENY